MFDSEEEIITRIMCSELPMETIQKAMQAIGDIERQRIKEKKKEGEVVEIGGVLYRIWF